MIFEILTLFPAMFEGPFSDSIIKRAREKGLISIGLVNFRDFTDDKHHTVDDYPYGGDPGMLIKPQPLARAIEAGRQRLKELRPKVVFLTPQGERLDHRIAYGLSRERALILLCGRYKGVDQRIIDHYVDQEISIGDFVLSGGEIPAMALVDAITRLIPGVLGNEESAGVDSFFNGLLSPPQYTRPEEFEQARVPEILLSGNHKKIEQWRMEQAIAITKAKRPDVWEKYCKDEGGRLKDESGSNKNGGREARGEKEEGAKIKVTNQKLNVKSSKVEGQKKKFQSLKEKVKSRKSIEKSREFK
jgi:tRNA (guanine37-N1)-methyltransferase